jgi:hypothetical protein
VDTDSLQVALEEAEIEVESILPTVAKKIWKAWIYIQAFLLFKGLFVFV